MVFSCIELYRHFSTGSWRGVGFPSISKTSPSPTQVSPSDSIDVNLNSHHYNNSFESTPLSSEDESAATPNPAGEFQHLLQDPFEPKADPRMDSSFVGGIMY